MYALTQASLLLLCSPLASAFPALAARQGGLPTTPFNAMEQYVSNKGAHAFVAPKSTDSRSPCPALNAMANHGYIPHDGKAMTLPIIQKGLIDTFGVGFDVATALAFVGLLFNGDGKQFNIGGWASPVNTGFGAGQFKKLYDFGVLNGTPDIMHTIATKYAASGDNSGGAPSDPVAGPAVGPLVDELIFRCMGNKSAAHTQGLLTPKVILPFLTMTPNGDGTFTQNTYQNRIPDMWYKRPAVDPYDAELLGTDIVQLAAYGGFTKPFADKIFAGLNMELLTLGTYSNADMANGLDAMCFFVQAAQFVGPALVKKSSVSSADAETLNNFFATFAKSTSSMACGGKKLKGMNLSILNEVGGVLGGLVAAL